MHTVDILLLVLLEVMSVFKMHEVMHGKRIGMVLLLDVPSSWDLA